MICRDVASIQLRQRLPVHMALPARASEGRASQNATLKLKKKEKKKKLKKNKKEKKQGSFRRDGKKKPSSAVASFSGASAKRNRAAPV
jgi:hypothetical protein